MRLAFWLLVFTPGLLAVPQEKTALKTLFIKGAKVYAIIGAYASIDDAVIHVENGRIKAVGKKIAIPADATVIDATGKFVIPGLVDAGSGLFLGGGDSSSGNADHDAADGIDFFEADDAREAIASGVTTIVLDPPNIGPIHGLSAGVRVRSDAGGRGHVMKSGVALKLSLGLASGETSTTSQRYGHYKALKNAFEGAKVYKESQDKYQRDLEEYERKKKEWDDKKKEAPAATPAPTPTAPAAPPEAEPKKPAKPRKDKGQEILLRCLDEKNPLTVRIEVHQVDAILNAIKLVQEFKLKAVLDQATEGHLVAADIAKAKIPVIVGPVLRYGIPTVDYLNHSVDCAAILVKAGVEVGIASFPVSAAGHSGPGAGRFLLEAAALASSRGLTRDQALRAVTFAPARALGLDSSVGSVAPGRQADLLILTGEPFEAGTIIEKVIVGGEVAAALGDQQPWPAATPEKRPPNAGDSDPKDCILFRGARIVPIIGEELPSGCILISNGTIIAIDAKIEPPPGAKVIDLPVGSWVVPGFIDLHSHLASVFEIEESTEPVTSHVKAVDAFSSVHRDVKDALRSGVTRLVLAPGNGNLVGGRPSILRLNGKRLDGMIWKDAFGMKLSLGTAALRSDREPTSKAGAAQMLREILSGPPGDLKRVLIDRKEPALVHASSLDEILRLVQVKESTGIRAILVHGSEAARAIEPLKRSGIGVAFGPMTPSDSEEKLRTPALLARAGIPVAFVSDAPVASEDQLRTMAALAVRYGMPLSEALKALTLTPARLLGIDTVVGSITPDRTGDLVVWSGHPLALSSDVEFVIVEGRIVHQKPKR